MQTFSWLDSTNCQARASPKFHQVLSNLLRRSQNSSPKFHQVHARLQQHIRRHQLDRFHNIVSRSCVCDMRWLRGVVEVCKPGANLPRPTGRDLPQHLNTDTNWGCGTRVFTYKTPARVTCATPAQEVWHGYLPAELPPGSSRDTCLNTPSAPA